MAWGVYFTAVAEEWVLGLDDDDYIAMLAAIELLEEKGPALGRPAADHIEGSRHHNMKEPRSFGGHLRALFAFDPKRRAIVLLDGDKRDDWTGWYERNIRSPTTSTTNISPTSTTNPRTHEPSHAGRHPRQAPALV